MKKWQVLDFALGEALQATFDGLWFYWTGTTSKLYRTATDIGLNAYVTEDGKLADIDALGIDCVIAFPIN